MEKMKNTRFEVEKFNGNNNFELWKLKMWDLLVQEGLYKALDDKRNKLVGMSDDEREDLDARGLKTIRLCLADEVFFNITGDETVDVWTTSRIHSSIYIYDFI
jgi:hypothetical protein